MGLNGHIGWRMDCLLLFSLLLLLFGWGIGQTNNKNMMGHHCIEWMLFYRHYNFHMKIKITKKKYQKCVNHNCYIVHSEPQNNFQCGRICICRKIVDFLPQFPQIPLFLPIDLHFRLQLAKCLQILMPNAVDFGHFLLGWGKFIRFISTVKSRKFASILLD